jgi:hypothetical protein
MGCGVSSHQLRAISTLVIGKYVERHNWKSVYWFSPLVFSDTFWIIVIAATQIVSFAKEDHKSGQQDSQI